MVTKIRTAKSNKSQTHQYFTQEVRSLTSFSDVSGLHQNRPENDTRSGPTSVADMDNLVYLYMSEMGQTPKINAAKEKELSSRIEQGRFLSRLEGELKVKLEDTPLPSDIMLELLERFRKARVAIDIVSREAGLNETNNIISLITSPLFHQKVDNFIDPIMKACRKYYPRTCGKNILCRDSCGASGLT